MKKNFKKLVLNKSTLSNLDSNQVVGGVVGSIPVRIWGVDIGTKPVPLGWQGCEGSAVLINNTKTKTLPLDVFTNALTCNNSRCTKC